MRYCIFISIIVSVVIVCITLAVIQKVPDRSWMQSSSNTTTNGDEIVDAVGNMYHGYLQGSERKSTARRLTYKTFVKLMRSLQQKCPKPSVVPPLPGKKGVGLTLREEGQPGSWVENLPKVKKLRPYWNYSWGPQRIAEQPRNIEFVPMVWGGSNAERLKDVINTHIVPQIKAGTAKRVLGFNEPDNKDQSNMEVSVAFDRWKEFESLKVPLVSPSCVNPGSKWMMSFMKSVDQKCKRVDWVGVHWYGTNFNSFKSAMIKYHDLYDRPILVTEFALADWRAKTVSENKISRADTLKFMKQAVFWLETQSWIVGYAWFSFEPTHPAGTSSALFNENGSLTTLGKFYASVQTNRPRGNRNIT